MAGNALITSSPENSSASQIEPETASLSGQGSGPDVRTIPDSQSPAVEPCGPQKLTTRRSGGPRTELGKKRASRNALKNGLYSKVFLLPSESGSDYERFFAEQFEDWQPVGARERLLVEEMASTKWRKRRFLLAERAECQKHTEFIEWDQQFPKPEENQKTKAWTYSLINYGLIQKLHNPDAVNSCLEILAILQRQIEKNGFNQKKDIHLLEKVYGARIQDHLRTDLYDLYECSMCHLEAPEVDRLREDGWSKEECRKDFLRKIEEEIRWLERHKIERDSIETARTEVEILRHFVPDASVLDGFQRYETSLDRAFYRAFHELERLQRIRKGLPVPPELKVRLSQD